MRTFLFCILSAFILQLSACQFFKNNPATPNISICDTIQTESVLCQLAEKKGMTLEEIGTAIVIVNYAAIRADVYSAGSAIEVLKQMKAVISRPVSYSYLRKWLLGTLLNAPELVEISEMFPNTPLIMYNADRDILIGFIDRHISNLEMMK